MTQRYDTYKDSGVQWLGNIPGHWGCVPVRRIAHVNPTRTKNLEADSYHKTSNTYDKATRDKDI